MRFVKISRPGMGGYIQPMKEVGNAVDGEFDGADPGEMITLRLVEMTQEEYDALPDFQGW